jgi:sugar phosphate permease
MIPKIVGQEKLANAITLNQATFLTASVSGHAIGGFLIALITIKWTLVVILFLILLASLFFLLINKQQSEYHKNELQVWASMKEGITYIYRTKEILGALCLDMFAVLFGGAVAMIPVYASDILKVGADGFGLLNAASDIGSMMIIVTLSFIPLRKNQGKILIGVVAGFGLCIIGFGLSKLYWLSFLFLMLSGIFDGISVVIRGTIVQLKTPDHIRGRVMSANSIFIMSSNEMGQFESGVAAKLLGVVRSVVFGGTMTVLIALFVGKFVPKLRKMEY